MTDVCAVWLQGWYGSEYQLFQSEDEAAKFAMTIETNGAGTVAGVQFADGRTFPREAWPAYREELKRRDEGWERAQAAMAAAPPKPKRKVKEPFSGNVIEVDASEPEWLGLAP